MEREILEISVCWQSFEKGQEVQWAYVHDRWREGRLISKSKQEGYGLFWPDKSDIKDPEGISSL